MSEYSLMTEHTASIPNDPARMREQLDASHARIRDLEHQLEETCSTAEELQRAFACLKEEYLALKRLMFGPRRERLPEDPNQQHLFDPGAPPLVPETPDADQDQSSSGRRRRKGHGRRALAEHLPREETIHDVPEDERRCACGEDKTSIGEDVTERLDYIPGRLVVVRHHYPKYACSKCKNGVTSHPTVPGPIPGGLPEAGLLAQVIVSKFFAHLPLYRQQDILARNGIFLPRSTLCGWLAQSAQVCRPLVELMDCEILRSHVIQADETPVPVLDPDRTSTRTGYLWARRGDLDHPYTIYNYTDSRGHEGPAAFLRNYRGFLQTDGYSAYDTVVRKSNGRIIALCCWAHARRKFFDARLSQPREVPYVLGLIEQLYEVETEAKGWSAEHRLAARQARSVPVLARLEAYLRGQRGEALPMSKYGEAIGYVLNRWDEMCRYTTDGCLEIDNNATERTIRPCAISRKNWLFFGSDRGGETAAILFSILANARRHLIEPFAYVRALLIASCSRPVDWQSLLPDVWIKAHPEHVLRYRRDEATAAEERRRRRRARRPARKPLVEPEPVATRASASGVGSSSQPQSP
jgi:transposase